MGWEFSLRWIYEIAVFFCPGGFPNFCIRKTNLVFSLCPGTIHFHVCFNWKMSKNTKMPPIGVTQDDLVAVVISGKMKNQPMKGENLTIWGKIDTILSLLCVGSCIFVVPCYFHSKKLQLMSIKIREKRKKIEVTNWSFTFPSKLLFFLFFAEKREFFGWKTSTRVNLSTDLILRWRVSTKIWIVHRRSAKIHRIRRPVITWPGSVEVPGSEVREL